MVKGNTGGQVTRLEVVDAVAKAFADDRYANRYELVAAAQAADARRQVLELLERLPEITFTGPGQMWSHLPDVPIGE
jgi:hypothetical protein